ncbi:MAG: biopolymer transporter ExbD [Puniceicoccales bacterium]|jgi:biopolymer transport protein ExbD|nr:biopolymer transporter ExbD [Puniceicoccales bacterium]
MSLFRPRKRRTDINIVPLIDVMTVLIFFFLMTMRFDETQALAITPPRAESADREFSKNPGELVVAVTKAGVFYINGKQADIPALKQQLAQTSKAAPGSSILVVADEQALTKDTIYVVDQVNKQKLVPRLITRPSR